MVNYIPGIFGATKEESSFLFFFSLVPPIGNRRGVGGGTPLGPRSKGKMGKKFGLPSPSFPKKGEINNDLIRYLRFQPPGDGTARAPPAPEGGIETFQKEKKDILPSPHSKSDKGQL